MKRRASHPGGKARTPSAVRRLAWFRYRLRRFLRFSERVTQSHGVTPQQYLLLLGIAGYTGRGWATISELAEFLQERHNAVVGLVKRAEGRALVQKDQSAQDRRYVRVRLSRRGTGVLRKLTSLHLQELRRIQFQVGGALHGAPHFIRAARGA
jgi:DNA-binding MarR family transcriptional regulator